MWELGSENGQFSSFGCFLGGSHDRGAASMEDPQKRLNSEKDPYGVYENGGTLLVPILRESYYLGSIFGVPCFRKPPYSPQEKGYEAGFIFLS